MKLAGKIAVVTGAGSGIGMSIAHLFSEEGACVVVADINVNGEKTSAAIIDSGGQAAFIRTDVSNPNDAKALMVSTIAKFGKLDILVNSAGIFSMDSPVENTDESEWDRVFAINVKGIFLTCKYAIPFLKSTGSGTIVNIASSVGVRPAPYHIAYVTSKGAVITLTKAMAIELATYHIRVNCINPGLTETPLSTQFTDEAKKQIINSMPLGCIVKPEDIAKAALYLVSDDSANVTGATLDVDGGQGI